MSGPNPSARHRRVFGPGIIAAGLLLASFPGCCSLENPYQETLALDAAARRARPALAAAAKDSCDVGIQVSLDALQRLLDQAGSLGSLPRFEKTLPLSVGSLDLPIELQALAAVKSLSVRASDRADGYLHIVAGFELKLDLSAPALLHAAIPIVENGYTVQGRIAMDIGLRLHPEGDRVTLRFDFSRAAVAAFDLVLEFLPPEVANPVREAIAPLASAIAGATLSDLWLLTIDPLALGHGHLAVTPVSFHTDQARNALFIGLATNLAMARLSPVRPWFDGGPPADIRVRLAAALPELTVRNYLHTGVVPRRYNLSVEPDDNGALRVTLNRLRIADGRLEASFRIWHLDWPCFYADLVARGTIARNNRGRFVANLEALELEQATAFEERIRKALWKQSKLAETLRSVSEGVLNEQYLGLPGGKGLSWIPTAYRLTAGAIEVDARVAPDSKPASAPIR